MTGPLTDEQMAALEAAQTARIASPPLSDEQMAALEQQHAAPSAPDPGLLAAIGHGTQSGLTFGFAPKIQAGVEAGLKSLLHATGASSEYEKEIPYRGFEGEYQNALKQYSGERDAAKEHHPAPFIASEMVGSLPYAAIGGTKPIGMLATGTGMGALQGLGESKDFIGEHGTNTGAVVDATLGGLGGLAGSGIAYGIGRGGVSLAGRWADRKAMDAVGATTAPARRELRSLLKTQGITAPGQFALMAREEGIAGGFQGLRSVEKAAAASAKGETEAFRGLIDRATETGNTVGLNDLVSHLQTEGKRYLSGPGASKGAQELAHNTVTTLAIQGIANRTGQTFDEVAEQLAKNPALLSRIQGNPSVTHSQLQEVLRTITPDMEMLRKKAAGRNPTISLDELGRLNIYNALRSFQDKGLEAAVGESGRPVRRAIALNSAIQRISGDRAEMLEGQKMVGLQSTAWGMGLGGILSGLGLPHVGIPVALAGLAEKSTAPLRANVLTSVLSRLQSVPKAIAATGPVAPAVGVNLLRDMALGLKPEDEQQPDPREIMPPEVANRILAQALGGKKNAP